MFSMRTRKTEDNDLVLTVTNRTVIRVLALVILSIIFLAILKRATHAIILIFTAFFLALALNAPVHWVSRHLPGKRRGNRQLATILSVLLVIIILVAFIASIVPPLVRQTSSFVSAAPSFVQDFRDQNSEFSRLIQQYHLQSQVSSFSSQLSDRLKNISSEAVSVVTHIGSSAFSVLTILVLTFMMLVEGPRWVRFFERLVPEKKLPHSRALALDMYHVVRGYVNGQVILALIASCLILPMLFILHISYPFALLLIIFICGLIPMVGHTLGAVIVTIVALFHSPISAIVILAYYILYQQIENYLIQPRIQANSTNMSPLLVFLAVVLGVNFGGLLGGLVAIPLMGCIRIFIIDQLNARHMLAAERSAEAASTVSTHETK